MDRWLWAILILHAVLLGSSVDLRPELWSQPIRNVDYTSHFYSANHFAMHVRNTHALWGYDPFWMAGYPEGFVGIFDNKFFAAVTALAPRGFEAATFNAAVLLSIWCIPGILYLTARANGQSRDAANGTALAACLLIFGAPITVFFWIAGGISFVLASALAVPATLGLCGAIDEGSLASRRGTLCIALGMLAVFVHPFAFLSLIAALVTAPFSRGRRLRRVLAESAVVVAFLLIPLFPVITTLAANLAQTRVIDTRGDFLRGGPAQLVRDFGTYLLRTDHHGVNGAGTLATVLLFAAFGFGSWRAAAPRRADLSVMAFALFIAYAGVAISQRLAALQPHRFLVVLGFFAALPAGWGVARMIGGARSRKRAAWLLAALCLVISVEAIWTLRRVRLLAIGDDRAEEAIPTFLQGEGTNGGRVLVESSLTYVPVGTGSTGQVLVIRFALLPLHIEREFLGNSRTGPFTAERFAAFGDGKILGRQIDRLSARDLQEILDRYAVSIVIACSAQAKAVLGGFAEILERRAELADCHGFRVKDARTSRLLSGEGEVRATFDRIEVRRARGERLVLKYHWIPALRTEPPLPIEEAPQPGSPVGFIAVRPEGRSDFAIVTR